MALTPGDVEQKTFSTALRGYDLDEVDDFLDEIVVSLRQHEEQYEEARARIAELEAAAASAPAASGMTPSDESAVGRALVIAQEAADKVVSDAKMEADEILSEARSVADSFEETREERRRAAEAEMARLRDLNSGLNGRLAEFTESVEAPVAGMEEVLGEAKAALDGAESGSFHRDGELGDESTSPDEQSADPEQLAAGDERADPDQAGGSGRHTPGSEEIDEIEGTTRAPWQRS